ncbi:helix-turn-helix domain-containing protein [Lentilactobacillus hilgardii]|uniref:Helix-turn-helix domain-containing protein n=1 Tax=Lentilactobacillus hilgardii TaxID=1588 RepID=A0A6P1E510_LENHI|nr:helix-turn-helix transcriptional regulator [Lentilactobacillus hilgardii]QHB52486.1 helix-turn-helix domain-containing protein [Lentilactobacillus hilgardii]
MSVYDNIKKYAKKRGMNLQTVAKKSGLSRNVIYQYNKGVNPTLETLTVIAKVLDVDVSKLLGDDTSISKKEAKKKPTVDLNKDDAILTFDGKPIPEEDMELIKRLLGK